MATSFHRLNPAASDISFKSSCNILHSKFISLEKSITDSILAHNNFEQAEIILADGRKFFWYFAIGSMINPISLYLRDLTSIISYPATCKDYKIVFRGFGGMADIEACPGAEFDGVVHLLCEEHMIRLDELEFSYNRIKIKCIDYHGQSHAVYVYQMHMNNQLTSLPHERYLDIIVKGCEYYKVRQEYINQLVNEQSVIPRKHPSMFKTFNDVPSNVFYSVDDLQKHNGDNSSLPLWICVNGKILEYVGLPPNDHPDYEFQRNFYTFIKTKLAGHEVATIAAKALYEPLYKIPLTDDDVCDENRARIEDFYCDSVFKPKDKIYWKPIGRLSCSNNLS